MTMPIYHIISLKSNRCLFFAKFKKNFNLRKSKISHLLEHLLEFSEWQKINKKIEEIFTLIFILKHMIFFKRILRLQEKKMPIFKEIYQWIVCNLKFITILLLIKSPLNVNIIYLFKIKKTMDEPQIAKPSLITRDDKMSYISEEQEPRPRLSLKKRYFSPMKEGSLRGSIFTLIASAMGTGMFNIPLRVKEIGVIPFVLFVIVGGLFSMSGMIFMVRLIRRKRFGSYSEMSLRSWGKPFMRLAQFCIIVYPWGVTICFQVILAKFVCQLLNDSFGLPLYEEDSNDTILTETGNYYRIFINLGVMVLTFLLALKKDIQLLQKASVAGVGFVVFNIGCILYVSFFGFTRPDDVYYPYHGIFHVDWSRVFWGELDKWRNYSYMLQGLSSLIFCFVNHQLLFPLTSKLNRPNKKRYSKIINRSHIVEFISYIFLGLMAYLLLIQNIDRHPIDSMVIASIPIPAITIGKGLMVIALFFAIPLNSYPARQNIFEAFEIRRSDKNHIVLTAGLICSSCLLAILFQGVSAYFGLLGGTAGVLMAAGIPAICYFRLTKNFTKKDVAMMLLVGMVGVLCFAGAALSMIDPPRD